MKAFFFGGKDNGNNNGDHQQQQLDNSDSTSSNKASQPLHVHPGSGSTASPDAVPERPFPGNSNSGYQKQGSARGSNQDGGFISAFQNITRGAAAQDAEMERRVSVAARNLGDGVQKIVQAAKGSGRQHGGSSQEWKASLLSLLGGADDQTGMFSKTASDIDILLENSTCDKFVLRCVENELPPNLIHCLRLLRVLELQHANSQKAENGPRASISQKATKKVTQLLCLLCKDPSVGEQLRPHLFGLLALSGASYPESGTHVASAASSVIVAFSEFCLSTSLVWFLHDRKMIVHMTDDIKELIGMTEVSSSATASLCLYGDAAEQAGLWVVAMKTVVNLVVFSCNQKCLELLNDFDAAGGYHVLCHAIVNSSGSHGKQLMELVTILACCKTENESTPSAPPGDSIDGMSLEDEMFPPQDDAKGEDTKLVSNPAACDIIEDLMVRSVPLLKEFDQVYGGQRPDITMEDSLRELSKFSLATALNVRFVGGGDDFGEFDLAMELLVTTLQLYSDHAKNYEIIEDRHNILAYYLLALPTFEDISLKVLILKTLEYVCTGVAGTNAERPLSVTTEIFFALCKSLLKGANGIELDSEEETKIYESLLMDAEMMCATIEKLIEFDDRVSEIMLNQGILTSKLIDVFDLVMQCIESSRDSDSGGAVEMDGRLFTLPPPATPLDRVFSVICRVLKLVVPEISSSVGSRMISNIDEVSNSASDIDAQMNLTALKLNEMLLTAVRELGDDAAGAALTVFENMMGAQVSSDVLRCDMDGVVEMLDMFAETAGRLGRLEAFNESTGVPKRKRGESFDETQNALNCDIGNFVAHNFDPHIILRVSKVLSMLKSALEISDIAQVAFRLSGGFDCILRFMLCLEGIANNESLPPIDEGEVNNKENCSINKDGAEAVLALLESTFGLLGAAVGKGRKQSSEAGGEALSSQAIDGLIEPFSASSPTANNRLYLQRKNFYVNFAVAIAGTGLLNQDDYARKVLNLTLSFMDPSLHLADLSGETENADASKPRGQFIRNPDASRLFMRLATCLPSTEFGLDMSKKAMGEMLRLCSPEMAGSTLPQLASCGLCWSITNPKEFAPILEDRSHHLYSRFVLLLRRLAAFSMAYTDFVELLRCIAGPMLREDGKDTPGHLSKRIRLPVISSSVRTTVRLPPTAETMTDTWKAKEDVYASNLETLCVIAERGDRTPRCELGGDNLNTVSVYMHKTKIEERLYAMAEEGRMKFLEVKSIDASAQSTAGLLNAGVPAPNSNDERIWTPLASSGFTYSCWLRLRGDKTTGSLFILDISAPVKASNTADFLSVWFDISTQRFNILSSASRTETCFPVSPLRIEVWHHVLLAYLPPKRPMLSRKAVLGMFVDGRPLEAEVRVESVNLPPNSRVHIGAPNPYLASTPLVKGSLPTWDLGPTLMFSTLLSNRDATAIFAAGPDFQGMFWGDRPQRLSLTATATTAFSMLAESGEQGSVAGALRRRGVPEVEAAGHVMRERGPGTGPGPAGPDADSLAAVNLLCSLQADFIVFGFRAASYSSSMRDGLSSKAMRQFSLRIVNVAQINSTNEAVSTDAIVYGKGGVISPHCFADNVQWIGGPNVLMPLVNAARSARSLALALRLIRESVRLHPPNLEMLQGGGGYRMMGVLLRQKRIMDESVLDQCFAFAVHGFDPVAMMEYSSMNEFSVPGVQPSWPNSDRWVFADLDAMKYLLLNHQVWDLRGSGPELPLRLLSFLNGLVAQHSAHKAFNSRRLHLIGIVRWTLHLMLEAAELYSAAEAYVAAQGEDDFAFQKSPRRNDGPGGNVTPGLAMAQTVYSNGWYVKAPSVASTAVGGDPDNALLCACKTLLRRVLTFMLTPGDLEAIADAAIYTVSITGPPTKPGGMERQKNSEDEKLLPGPVARVYLLRLIEELVVDGVNEIVSAGNDKKASHDAEGPSEPSIQPHAGGGASTNQSYLATSMINRKKKSGSDGEGLALHPKHQQAQAFLQAFGGVLTPVWFACLLEGCHEEASASAVLRLMILMLQSSPMFAAAFEEAGGFAPLVLSIPKFSTCPSITMSMLSQLLHAPILHLPCFGTLDAAQLCEVFDAESDATELIMKENIHGGLSTSSDPSCGIFALLAECLGRNIQLAPFDNDLGHKARQTNEAVLQLLSHRHRFSSAFQEFCRTPDFLEPLAQALCLVHDEKIQRMQQQKPTSSDKFEPQGIQVGGEVARMKRRGSLADVPTDETPTERFVGRPEEETGSSGIGMVQLLHLVVSHAVLSGPLAAPLVSALFRSFPIHASPEQVEAFHLVLIEHCRSVVEDALQRGEPIALANSLGVSSVLLDRLMAGFFTSEPVLEAVNIVMSVLECLTTSSTPAARILGTAEQAMLTADAAHLSRLTCLKALQRSRPMSQYDEGDPDLNIAILDIIRSNVQALMIVPSGGSNQGTKRQSLMGGGTNANLSFQAPLPGSRLYPFFQSASLARCTPSHLECMYRDLTALSEPDRAFVVALMDELHSLLLESRANMRDSAVTIVISLLQSKRGIMSELLVAEVMRGDRLETIDIMNRGGFGALLVAHEAASYAENVNTVKKKGSGDDPVSERKYASFFQWLERNEAQVDAVFSGIHSETIRLFPESERGAATPEEAIENEQKVMLLKLTSQDSSDRTILGGLERAELAQRCYDKTAESHALWKRQGFDDLSSGAMRWKFLLRQLKGSASIWEGGIIWDDERFSKKKVLARLVQGFGSPSKNALAEDKFSKNKSAAMEVITRWKLDLTEGYERQRRRLLPNYEFHGLYNLDENVDHDLSPVSKEGEVENDEEEVAVSDDGSVDSAAQSTVMQWKQPGTARRSSTGFVVPDTMEATADLLRDLNLGRAKGHNDDEDFFDMEGMEDETETAAESLSTAQDDTTSVSESVVTREELSEVEERPKKDESNGTKEEQEKKFGDEQDDDDSSTKQDNVLASSYDLITGLLQAGDWPEKSYNINRCTGLEVRKGLLLWCREAIYIIDGFEQTDGEGLEGKINRIEKESTSFYINLRPQDFKASEGNVYGEDNPANFDDVHRGANKGDKAKESSAQDASDEVTYQHRSQRIAFSDLYSVFRRRYQLQQVGLEFFDVHRSGTLLSFSNNSEREEVLTKILNTSLPNSIFNIQGYVSSSINYKKFMNNWKNKVVTQWVSGKMTNFDFLMHLNSFAGRSYNDLTQYPVFPWVIADYESEELDLNDPATFRDLSKPMGALGAVRAEQFKERYESLAQTCFTDEDPPPFHYGTHYSCAAYVVGYLMRLEPFARLALSLQGGRFDVADRLFHNVGYSWRSASFDNLQDVRELIPEFFYLPEFLDNSNGFDFGITQSGKTVHDVTLPAWAKGCPKRFVRLNRLALESEYVSKHLHKWVDLIFGYKQRGPEAVDCLNLFVHVTYEGEVDLETMEDPIQRESTLAQIQNFGQTPSRLERKPFQSRQVVSALKDKNIDFGSLSNLAPLTPPFCVVGAPFMVHLRVAMTDTCKLGMAGQSDSAVGDMCLVRGQLIGVGRTCTLIIPKKYYYRFGGPNNGVSVHAAATSTRVRELNKMLSIHDGMHRAPISVAKASKNGLWLVTGCFDSTVRVWRYDHDAHKMHLRASLCGHEGGRVTCIDISTVYGTIVTGDVNGTVLVWDLRTLTFLRRLRHPFKDAVENDPGSVARYPAVSVSTNDVNGNIVTLVGSHLSVFSINGSPIASHGPGDEFDDGNTRPSCAVATGCPEWVQNGVAVVTGHMNGDVKMWRLDYEEGKLHMCHRLQEKPHSCPITVLRVEGERQDTLLVGDKSGRMSVCKTIQLENLNQAQLTKIVQNIRDGVTNYDIEYEEKKTATNEGGGLMGIFAAE